MTSTISLGVILLLLATTLEAFGQLSLKGSATNSGAARAKWLSAGIGCMTLEAVVWTFVLRLLNVSIAYPMGSMSFVMVVLLSKLILKERVTRERWLGVAFILCGTALLAVSSPQQ